MYRDTVPNPHAVVVNAQEAAIADLAVVTPGWQDKLTRVAEEELAEVRQFAHLFLGSVDLLLGRSRLQLHELNFIISVKSTLWVSGAHGVLQQRLVEIL